MGRYQYQIFSIGLHNNGIDKHKQYLRVSIHVSTTLRMRKVYVSTHSREISASSQIASITKTCSFS